MNPDNRITLRPGRPEDVGPCGEILFGAFGAVNARHGFPSDFPVPEAAAGLAAMALAAPAAYSLIAEAGGRVVGSNFLWDCGLVAGIGPITVDPAVQGRAVGRMLMDGVLARARERGFASVRLVQAAFNTVSMSLYTKLGFDVREPLVCLQGTPARDAIPGYAVRKATAADVPACNDVCARLHGHAREVELRMGIEQTTATVVEQGGAVVGYASDIGFFGHVAALDNAGLKALIGAAEQISGPGMLLPSRNGDVFRWCLAGGLKVVQPMTLMSLGLYNEPRGAFVPSILF